MGAAPACGMQPSTLWWGPAPPVTCVSVLVRSAEGDALLTRWSLFLQMSKLLLAPLLLGTASQLRSPRGTFCPPCSTTPPTLGWSRASRG